MADDFGGCTQLFAPPDGGGDAAPAHIVDDVAAVSAGTQPFAADEPDDAAQQRSAEGAADLDSCERAAAGGDEFAAAGTQCFAASPTRSEHSDDGAPVDHSAAASLAFAEHGGTQLFDSGPPDAYSDEPVSGSSRRAAEADAEGPASPELDQPQSPECADASGDADGAEPAQSPQRPVDEAAGDKSGQSDGDSDDADALPADAIQSLLDDDADSEAENGLAGGELDATAEGQEGPPPQEDVDHLIADIFGESDDDEDNAEGDGALGAEAARLQANQDSAERDDSPPDDRTPVEYDFDVIMREKADERRRGSRRRRRGRDGAVDIVNDADGLVQQFIDKMRRAAQEDRKCNEQRQPALNKRKMLSLVVDTCKKLDLAEVLLDNGLLSAISEWLAPLPDKGLPALEIRVELLKLLGTMANVEPNLIKSSGVGKAVMLLSKHPREDRQNRLRAKAIIGEWARPIFNLDEQLSRQDREERDQRHLPAKRRRVSAEEEPAGDKDKEKKAKPGEKGFVQRARVPQPSKMDYVIRPKSTVEGDFKMSTKRSRNRYDVKYREFQTKTRMKNVERAVNVSLVGKEGKA